MNINVHSYFYGDRWNSDLILLSLFQAVCKLERMLAYNRHEIKILENDLVRAGLKQI